MAAYLAAFSGFCCRASERGGGCVSGWAGWGQHHYAAGCKVHAAKVKLRNTRQSMGCRARTHAEERHCSLHFECQRLACLRVRVLHQRDINLHSGRSRKHQEGPSWHSLSSLRHPSHIVLESARNAAERTCASFSPPIPSTGTRVLHRALCSTTHNCIAHWHMAHRTTHALHPPAG